MGKNRLINLSRVLRKEMTDEERKLWFTFLKHLPVTFKRQKIFGNYILDFFCPDALLAIELDGSQHGKEENVVKDRERDSFLNSKGIEVARYSNYAIHTNFEGIKRDVLSRLKRRLRYKDI